MSIPILILSGPVGAGKTTVAREMVSQLGDDVVLIEMCRWTTWCAAAIGAGVRLTQIGGMTGEPSPTRAPIPTRAHFSA